MQAEAQNALRRVWLKQELARHQQRCISQPQNVDAWQHIGRIAWELGEAELALAALEQVLIFQPEDSASLMGKTAIYLALNSNQQALTTANNLLARFPASADAMLYQIEALLRLGQAAAALEANQRLTGLSLTDGQRFLAAGQKINALLQLGRFEDARAAVEQALVFAPQNGELRLQQLRLLQQLKRYTETLEIAEVALTLPSIQLQVQCIKARTLALLRRFDEADALLNLLQATYPHRVLEMEFEAQRLPDQTLPDSLHKRYTARGLYLMKFFNDQAECDWQDRDWVMEHITELLADTQRYGFVAGMEPHNLLQLPIAPALQLSVAQRQARAVDILMEPTRKQLGLKWQLDAHRQRLRIGYVSGDFREHATAHLIRKLFAVHDRNQFEIFAYSLRPGDDSYYWRDIKQSCDHFVELYGISNADAAARIVADGIQILVDLHGYTRFARPELFALRPAPIQIAFLGYPGTLGADYIPYIVADRVVLPETLLPYFSEQPIYLDCYQVSDDEEPIAENAVNRAEAGLPESAFVYCCFNTPYKIDPETFAVWMRILQKTPGSVLWLLAGSARYMERLRNMAATCGVAPQRIIFAPRLPKAQHLERHRCADLFIDTFVVNAHTSARDALWAGLPVLTLPGNNFQSRVCASLLLALGLPAAVAKDQNDYETQAIELSINKSRLLHWRTHLEHCREGAQGSATRQFVAQLEHKLLEIWRGTTENG